MYHELPPIKCSKCGSTNVWKPVNGGKIRLKCGNCNHRAYYPDATREKNKLTMFVATNESETF